MIAELESLLGLTFADEKWLLPLFEFQDRLHLWSTQAPKTAYQPEVEIFQPTLSALPKAVSNNPNNI